MPPRDGPARLIAFYLPQFHPIPENDEWWGKGFTEWRNVVRARPRFRGHYQPHLPADLGFYDLRVPETRQAQADLAREHSVYGFCYYHYWFNGRRLLERPFQEVLESGRPDFPFCLCWANEEWTRAWDGRTGHVLIGQDYNESDDREHLRWLAGAFEDPRYIRVDGKPLFLVYRAGRIPDPRRTTDIWRDEASKLGIGELMLCCVESFSDEGGDPWTIGFDAAVEFQPRWRLLRPSLSYRVLRRLGLTRYPRLSHMVYDYADVVRTTLGAPTPPYPRIPCVTPMWDNSARRASLASILHGSTPDLYEHWLKTTIDRALRSDVPGNIVFVNAWNEWAEGCHLEPCMRWGLSYLKATKRAVESTAGTEAGETPCPR